MGSPGRGPVFLWFHGNAGNITTAWKISSSCTIWRRSRSSSSTTGVRQIPGQNQPGSTYKDAGPRPIATWRKRARCPRARSSCSAAPWAPPWLPIWPPGFPAAPDPRIRLHQLLRHGQALRPFMFDWRPRSPMTIWEKLLKLRCRCSSSTAPTTRLSLWKWATGCFAAAADPKEFYLIPGAPPQRYLPGGWTCVFREIEKLHL